ncbi:TetR/AcrR family transcriptional regulator [Sinosporangium siamense]|uniref:TetR family transcriptional regulator n=1 Tax=Sinosporangium siamense TaxID=1367973 RepID=A0A919RI86_9ACTN|nr:TetR/AcrR family transcriptional regulator [Sinosporangium siamense]GII92456.1 TetR family transcriptional regulator [Sinosporangium siamense]
MAVAAELFARTGFRGTGMTEIAARVGITEPGLLYHFRNKEGLLRAVIEWRDARSLEFAREVGALGGLRTIREMPAFAHRNHEEAGLTRLFAVLLAENLDPGAPAHETFVRRYREMRRLVTESLQVGQERGEIRPEVDPRLKAVEILATLDGISTQWLLDPESVDLVESIEAYAKSLEHDLAPHPATSPAV